MQIIWYGQSSFQITTSQGKNEQTKIVIDPFSENTGLKLPSVETDIVLITHNHEDHNNKKGLRGNPFLIEGPGEYDIKGVFIQGIPAFHDSSQGKERGKTALYIIEAEEMRICHLGDFGQKELTPEQLEKIGDVDILMVPVGGVYTIDANGASKIISQIEPRIAIPMHYSIPKLEIKLEKIDGFLKTMGVKSVQPIPKLMIKKKDFSQDEETKIIILSP